MTRNDEVVNYVTERIEKELSEDIDLLVCYGSYINGTDNRMSDVDMYYIPKHDKGYDLSETFILEGVGYDIFSLSWKMLERIAEFKDNLSPLLGDVKILYSYSEQETNRFSQLVQRMNECLNDAVYMEHRAYDVVEQAVGRYRCMIRESALTSIRLYAGEMLMHLAQTVAYANQTYFHKGLKTQYIDLKTFEKMPVDFEILYHDIIIEHDLGNIRDRCYEMLVNTIKFLQLDHLLIIEKFEDRVLNEKHRALDQSEDKRIDYEQAARWYEEVSSTFNKIQICAENKDYPLAFITACCLQSSLQFDCSVNLATTDLLSEYKYDNLEHLLIRTREIEKNCINEIENNGVKIRRIESIRELTIVS